MDDSISYIMRKVDKDTTELVKRTKEKYVLMQYEQNGEKRLHKLELIV